MGDKSKAKAPGADGAAPRPAQATGRTWWKFRIPDGSFGWVFLGLFFPFSLSHFQGNKTRCHLLVAIAISPDSASAAEEEKSRESAVLPRSPELLRPELWGEHGSMGLYPTEAMGRFTGSKEGAAGFLEHKSALLLTASVPARCAAHLGTSPCSAYRGGLGAGGPAPTCGCTQRAELGFGLPPIPHCSTALPRCPRGTGRNGGEAFSQWAQKQNAPMQPRTPPAPHPVRPTPGGTMPSTTAREHSSAPTDLGLSSPWPQRAAPGAISTDTASTAPSLPRVLHAGSTDIST